MHKKLSPLGHTQSRTLRKVAELACHALGPGYTKPLPMTPEELALARRAIFRLQFGRPHPDSLPKSMFTERTNSKPKPPRVMYKPIRTTLDSMLFELHGLFLESQQLDTFLEKRTPSRTSLSLDPTY